MYILAHFIFRFQFLFISCRCHHCPGGQTCGRLLKHVDEEGNGVPENVVTEFGIPKWATINRMPSATSHHKR